MQKRPFDKKVIVSKWCNGLFAFQGRKDRFFVRMGHDVHVLNLVFRIGICYNRTYDYKEREMVCVMEIVLRTSVCGKVRERL